MKLYDQTGKMLELQKLVDDGEMSQDDIQDTLDGMQLEFNDKASSIVSLAESLQGDVSALDIEIKRLQARKKAITNNQDRLKEYLRHNMELSGITKIKSPLFSITLGKATVTADVVDVDFLPDEFVNTEVVIKADKKAILKALKDGQEIPGAVLSTGKSRLLIK